MEKKQKTMLTIAVVALLVVGLFMYMRAEAAKNSVYTQITVVYKDGSSRIIEASGGTLQIQDSTGKEISAITPSLWVNVVYEGNATSMKVTGTILFYWSWELIHEVLNDQSYKITLDTTIANPSSGQDFKVWERRFDVAELISFWNNIPVSDWLNAGKDPNRRSFVCQILKGLAVEVGYASGPPARASLDVAVIGKILLEKSPEGKIISITAWVEQQSVAT